MPREKPEIQISIPSVIVFPNASIAEKGTEKT
jgi:hypothetical protein